jgi:hypothetical protein
MDPLLWNFRDPPLIFKTGFVPAAVFGGANLDLLQEVDPFVKPAVFE